MAESAGRRAVRLAGLVFIAVIVGFAVGREIFDRTSTTQVHVFKYFNNKTGVLTKGFACLCVEDANSITSWNGGLGNSCDATSSNDQDNALTLSDSWIPASKRINKPMPTGACCKQQPKTIAGVLPAPVKVGTNCWVP